MSSAAGGSHMIVSSFRGKGLCGPVQAPTSEPLEPGCAVAVCTYRRSQSLTRFLDSLLGQERVPDQVIIVDASPDAETEHVVRDHSINDVLGERILYFRVAGPLHGLTRQRNFALRWVNRDLVAFFDDDIVLLPGCLRVMELEHRAGGEAVVAVGAWIENQYRGMTARWRLRRMLGIVSTLRPGSYCRSGISIPWSLQRPMSGTVQGDWLPGCAMMFKAHAVRAEGFDESLDGYGSSEDLELSLRIAHRGKLMLARTAKVLHLHAPEGRLSASELSYTHIRNRYRIHRSRLCGRDRRDAAWFWYALVMDAILETANLLWPARWGYVIDYWRGRLRFVGRVLWSGGTP